MKISNVDLSTFRTKRSRLYEKLSTTTLQLDAKKREVLFIDHCVLSNHKDNY
jgi:hypothetical protein